MTGFLRIIVVSLLAVVTVLPVGTSRAETVVRPSAELAPEDVISIQLKALADADSKSERDSGIAQVWAFAHPDNRVITGPLTRFARMFDNRSYRALVGHRHHHMRLVSLSVDAAVYGVRVTAVDGSVYGYSWQLGKVRSGSFKDMWMTTAVVLVGKLGQEL